MVNMEVSKIRVVKEDGQFEVFSPNKVKRALYRSGLGKNETEEIMTMLESKLYDGISTREIYRNVYKELNSLRPEITHKYNLKRALQEMGPAGYPFEDFTSRLLVAEGYTTKIRQILQGACITHEIDVVATKNNMNYMVECKFHNKPGYTCRIQAVLYVHSRYLDLKQGAKKGLCKKPAMPWLVTNTKFSEDVLRYAECMGIPLLGWRYPIKTGIEALIEKHGCYPITVMNMKKKITQTLIKKGIVTVLDIPKDVDKLAEVAETSVSNAKTIIE
ncbi:MAG: ATP cone domain-containing protein, partial [Candidatus Micrarchaeota archaeon]